MRRREIGRTDDHDELAEWLRQGYPTAYRTAYGLLRNPTDAEDAVQEAFLRAWRFRAAVPTGEGIQPWLYRVVVNACLSKLRRDGRYRASIVSLAGVEGPQVSPSAGAHHDPETMTIDRVTRETVLDALTSLAEPLRVVVVLRYYGGLSEREIAAVIHRRPGTVKSRLHEARRRLADDSRLANLDGSGQSPVAAGAIGAIGAGGAGGAIGAAGAEGCERR